LPRRPPDDDDDFTAWSAHWQRAGVFTLADQFGDDGTKNGEFEAFLNRVDEALLAETRNRLGDRNKPLVGAYFADKHPQPPREVLELYKQISRRFKLATKL
jgi:hypothetical protein